MTINISRHKEYYTINSICTFFFVCSLFRCIIHIHWIGALSTKNDVIKRRIMNQLTFSNIYRWWKWNITFSNAHTEWFMTYTQKKRKRRRILVRLVVMVTAWIILFTPMQTPHYYSEWTNKDVDDNDKWTQQTLSCTSKIEVCAKNGILC